MPREPMSQLELQRAYYAKTAGDYERMRADETEHTAALAFLRAMIEHHGIRSVLDVGSGTGLVLRDLRHRYPALRVVGVEPVAELREVAYAAGIGRDELVEGDATALEFADGEFDLVCSFGVLHHIRDSSRAVSEMLRVARRALFISDSNNFGQGSALTRTLKQAVNAAGLWRLANLAKTRGRGYSITEGDGLAYSYSVFNDYPLIRARCSSVHTLNVSGNGVNHYRSAGHVALLGLKG